MPRHVVDLAADINARRADAMKEYEQLCGRVSGAGQQRPYPQLGKVCQEPRRRRTLSIQAPRWGISDTTQQAFDTSVVRTLGGCQP